MLQQITDLRTANCVPAVLAQNGFTPELMQNPSVTPLILQLFLQFLQFHGAIVILPGHSFLLLAPDLRRSQGFVERELAKDMNFLEPNGGPTVREVVALFVLPQFCIHIFCWNFHPDFHPPFLLTSGPPPNR